MRQKRKVEHVRLALEERGGGSGLGDLVLVHNSLPELALAEVDLSTALLGCRLEQPLIINAMTGGAPEVGAINRDLARVARALGLAMAVGSQRAGLEDPAVAATYSVVREENPDGVVLANLGAGAGVADARRAMAMVRADILQVHLNAPQELAMAEGDRDFRGQLDAIAGLVAAGLPVLVKECGFGMSRETAARLHAAGVRAVDVAGRGGTNFARIEARRAGVRLEPALEEWGIPTAASLLEVLGAGLPGLEVVASGGVRYGSEAAAALAAGAAAVGMAGPVLQALHRGGVAGCRTFLERVLASLRAAVLLAGARNLAELRRCPLVVRGDTAAWCRARGIDADAYARRGGV